MEIHIGENNRLQPDHISAYCLTYEEDTEFFLRHARGELLQDTDADAAFFEMAMSILEDAGYEQYEISNYARLWIFISSQPRLLAGKRLSRHRSKRVFDCRHESLAECL